MAIERKVLLIEGMTCVNCQNRIEQALRNISGISKVYVSYSKGQAEIEFDNDILTQDRIIAVIQNLDYKVVKKRKKDNSEFCKVEFTFAKWNSSLQLTEIFLSRFFAEAGVEKQTGRG